jgi:hypothetical protein
MVKALFFDAGPIITLVMSRMVWLLPKLKEKYGGKFYITPSVKTELIERPLKIKRFEFEALQVMRLIEDKVIEVYDNVPIAKSKQLLGLANSSFKIKNKTMDIIQAGEIESVASAIEMGADGIVMDERTLRLLIENGNELEKLLEYRFKRDVISNYDKIKQFSQEVKNVKIIRSIELVSVAFKLGLLNSFQPKIAKGKEKLVDAILWATKYNGCAVTGDEIMEISESLLKS